MIIIIIHDFNLDLYSMSIFVIITNDNTKNYHVGTSVITDKVRFVIYLIFHSLFICIFFIKFKFNKCCLPLLIIYEF